VIVTAGSPADGKLPSLFPRGIVIGTVTSAGQNDTDIYWQIQVTPYANLGSLQTVLVLIPKPAAKSKP
jgi:cell shape-determining protein MreC